MFPFAYNAPGQAGGSLDWISITATLRFEIGFLSLLHHGLNSSAGPAPRAKSSNTCLLQLNLLTLCGRRPSPLRTTKKLSYQVAVRGLANINMGLLPN